MRGPRRVFLRATSIGLIARATSLHPPGAPEVDASRQPARRDRALSNSVATPGQAAVLDEAVGACSRSCRTSKPVPRSSAVAARRATVSDPDVALLSSPRTSHKLPPSRRRCLARHCGRAARRCRHCRVGTSCRTVKAPKLRPSSDSRNSSRLLRKPFKYSLT
jgi:hypothetical protein